MAEREGDDKASFQKNVLDTLKQHELQAEMATGGAAMDYE